MRTISAASYITSALIVPKPAESSSSICNFCDLSRHPDIVAEESSEWRWHKTRPDDDGKMTPMEMVKPRLSYADLERMAEDGRRYELYDGEVWVVPAPILRHQIVAQRLWRILDDYASLTGGLAVISPID